MTAPRITICICTYDRYDVLPKAIESAKAQTLDQSLYRIIVVDNSPDHAQAEEFGRAYHKPPFLTYHIEETPGLSNARNVGTRDCGTEFIAFMDDDAIASNGWLENLLIGFDRFGENVAVVGGRVDPIWGTERPLWLGDRMLGYVSVVNWGGEMRIANEKEWLAGTNIAFRTATVTEAGGFDVNLGRKGGGSSLMSNEEVMIVNHLRNKGLRSVYSPEASVRHLVERKRLQRSWFRRRVAWQAVSDYTAEAQAAASSVRKYWEVVTNYLFSLPPAERTIRGLYYDTDSPELLQQQLDAIYIVTLAQLSGFEGIAAQDRAALGA